MTEQAACAVLGIVAGLMIGGTAGAVFGRAVALRRMPNKFWELVARNNESARMLDLQTRRADLAERQLSMITMRG